MVATQRFFAYLHQWVTETLMPVEDPYHSCHHWGLGDAFPILSASLLLSHSVDWRLGSLHPTIPSLAKCDSHRCCVLFEPRGSDLWLLTHLSVPAQWGEDSSANCNYSLLSYSEWKRTVRSNVFTNIYSLFNYTGCCKEIIILPEFSSYECSSMF